MNAGCKKDAVVGKKGLIFDSLPFSSGEERTNQTEGSFKKNVEYVANGRQKEKDRRGRAPRGLYYLPGKSLRCSRRACEDRGRDLATMLRIRDSGKEK